MSKNQGRQFYGPPDPLGIGCTTRGGGNYREVPILKWHKPMKDAEAFAANILFKLLIRTHRCLLFSASRTSTPTLSHGRHQVRGCRDEAVIVAHEARINGFLLLARSGENRYFCLRINSASSSIRYNQTERRVDEIRFLCIAISLQDAKIGSRSPFNRRAEPVANHVRC
jgi:hypothetical protein